MNNFIFKIFWGLVYMINQNKKERTKYNCIIEEIDNAQIHELQEHINKSKNLEPWLLTFVKRFCILANRQNLSKKDVSEACLNNKLQKPHLKGTRDILPAPTLSSITNPDSENIRLPNVNHLIVLSKFFDVSIDYLVGLSDMKKNDNVPINQKLGLTEKSIRILMLYNRILQLNKYSPFPECGLPTKSDNSLDIEDFPSYDSDGFFEKYYYNNQSFTKEKFVNEINSLFSDFSDIFSEQATLTLRERKEIFDNIKPEHNMHKTLELLLSHNNGNLLNLISQYLHFSDTNNIIQPPPDYASQEALLLSKIQNELVRIHDSQKNNFQAPM